MGKVNKERIEPGFISRVLTKGQLAEYALAKVQPFLDAEQGVDEVIAIDGDTDEVIGRAWSRVKTGKRLYGIPGNRYKEIFGPKIAG